MSNQTYGHNVWRLKNQRSMWQILDGQQMTSAGYIQNGPGYQKLQKHAKKELKHCSFKKLCASDNCTYKTCSLPCTDLWRCQGQCKKKFSIYFQHLAKDLRNFLATFTIYQGNLRKSLFAGLGCSTSVRVFKYTSGQNFKLLYQFGRLRIFYLLLKPCNQKLCWILTKHDPYYVPTSMISWYYT